MSERELPQDIPSRKYLSLADHSTTFPVPVSEAIEDYKRQKAIAIEQVFVPELMEKMQRFAEGPYEERVNAGGRVEFQKPPRSALALNMLFSRPEVLRWMEEITGSALTFVRGEVFRMQANGLDHFKWHDDLMDQRRRVALVVRLGAASYQGGELEMRERDGAPFLRHSYTEPGNAVILKIDPELQHRVLPVTAGGPRLMFGAWAYA